MATRNELRERKRALEHARALLRRHILIDGHNDLPWAIRTSERAPGDLIAYDLRRRTTGQTDLRRLRTGGVGGQFWSVFVPAEIGSGFARMQLEQLELARRMIAGYPRDLELCWSARDVRQAFARGRVASLLGMEGGHVLENSMGALRAFHELGARYLTLTHSLTNDWADSATDEARHGGLSAFGREVVREMNRLGMLVDLSHVAPTTMRDGLETSEAPIIFSHSSARALCDVPRNVPDNILTHVPANGGVVMVTFVAGFVSPDAAAVLIPAITDATRRMEGITDEAARRAISREVIESLDVPIPPLSMAADHVEHVAQVAGVEHVGIGGDFDGTVFSTQGLEDVSGYPNLFAELILRGWADTDLARLAGGNVLRVMAEAEAVARRTHRAGRGDSRPWRSSPRPRPSPRGRLRTPEPPRATRCRSGIGPKQEEDAQMRRVVIGLIGASLLAAASVGSALAKEGDVEVTLTPVQPPHAGQPTTFSVTVARPSGTPIAGEKVTFVLARVADTQVVRVVATEQMSGHYSASITLPDAGSWVVSVRVLDEGGMGRTFPLGSLHVQPALPAATKSTTASTLLVPAWTLALTMILGAAMALGGAYGIAYMRRRRLTPAPAPTSAPSASTVGATSAVERTQA